MESLLGENYLLTAGILFSAYIVRGIAGFGSGLIAIPLLALLYPLELVVPLVVILDYLGSTAQGVKSREAIKWRELLPLLPFTIAGCILAIYFFTSVNPTTLKTALGFTIIVFALYQILPLPAFQGSRFWAAPTGFTGGLIGTLFGTGGPFYMIYLSMRNLDKTSTRASFAAYFFVDGTIRIVGYLLAGLLVKESFTTLAVWIVPAALGLYCGGKVHTELSNQTFKYMISLLLVFSGYRLLT